MLVLGWNSQHVFQLWCSAATRGPYSLCHRVLEPDPELSPRRGRQEGLPPLHGPPVALREGDVQLSHWELGDDLAQRLGKEPVVGHWESQYNITQIRVGLFSNDAHMNFTTEKNRYLWNLWDVIQACNSISRFTSARLVWGYSCCHCKKKKT